jgi:VIT1/CCC1 family predicted Fe2+/Mn2+ transporter
MKTTEITGIQTEVDAAYLYARLADVESDPVIADVFRQMSGIEHGHAMAFMRKSGGKESDLPSPSMRARILNRIGKLFGYEYVLGVLMETEKRLAGAVTQGRKVHGIAITGGEANHVRIIDAIRQRDQKLAGISIARFEKRHRSVGGNALRAAVLGGNDGLVSNFSLVMGVAGAAAGESTVVLTGIAGLLAGALSMALGEWISVKSSQELYENQMAVEMEELEHNPEGEQQELALIYIAKGIQSDEAHRMAAEVMRDKDRAHAVLVREELGINPEELDGSAMEAAVFSFVLFAVGAILPVIPFFFLSGMNAIFACAGISALGLFLIGSAITLFTSKPVIYSGMRQVLFGLTAAAITFGIGRLIGVSIG